MRLIHIIRHESLVTLEQWKSPLLPLLPACGREKPQRGILLLPLAAGPRGPLARRAKGGWEGFCEDRDFLGALKIGDPG